LIIFYNDYYLLTWSDPQKQKAPKTPKTNQPIVGQPFFQAGRKNGIGKQV